ncbi:MAG TPA: SDR family NAD(P)-dependent oxidoreductase, partial [Candidatus Acidoferrales bacterium]|nr:SDR family NAD(P)-dependent oxidoreductase [Candidatus Acidoferrales bacterium]
MNYQDKIALITGASSGIGRVAALAFAKRGATVVAVARREPLLQQLIEECRPHSPLSIYLCGDLGERDFAEGVVDKTVEQFGRIDFLINNAAISK